MIPKKRPTSHHNRERPHECNASDKPRTPKTKGKEPEKMGSDKVDAKNKLTTKCRSYTKDKQKVQQETPPH